MRPTAFTLLELLVVVAIIGVLIALLIPGLNLVRFASKAYDTSYRLRAIEQGLRSYGDAVALHGKVIRPGLQAAGESNFGVVEFQPTVGMTNFISGSSYAGGLLVPQVGNWIDPTKSWFIASPWGKPAFGTNNGVAEEIRGQPDQPVTARHLGELSPRLTADFLRAAGALELEADWLNDRSPKRSWNDAWGHPLVVGFMLYQPQQNTTIQTTYHGAAARQSLSTQVLLPDLYIKRAKKAFGYDRSVYLTFGAVGPTLRTPLTGASATDAGNLWGQVTDTCEAASWTETAWEQRPPEWKDEVRRGCKRFGANDERCFLTPPIEIR